MKRFFFFSSALVLLSASALAAPPSNDPSGISDAVGPVAPGKPVAVASAAPAGPNAPNPRRGLVTVEQGARVVATGVVLDGDGRVLSGLRIEGPDALKSPDVTIKYGDNARVRAKVLHADTVWGLALVVPFEGKRPEGLRASEADVSRVLLHVQEGAQAKPARVEGFSGRYLLATPLPGLLSLAEPAGKILPGAPVLDEGGAVAGIAVRVCGQAPMPTATAPTWGPSTCDIPGVAPVSAIRGFLAKTPSSAVAPPPWLGIVGQPSDAGAVRGVRVVAVANGSPAGQAGLRGSADPAKADVIASVDGQAIATPEDLGEKIASHAVGDRVKLLVFNGKNFRDLVVTLRPAP